MAMATTCFTPPASSPFHNATAAPPKRFISLSTSFSIRTKISLFPPHSSPLLTISGPRKARVAASLAVTDEEQEEIGAAQSNHDESVGDVPVSESDNQSRPCELYVCNIPRSLGIEELTEMFKPFDTVLSVEVSRNPETGVSRGCAYVTMGSTLGAKKAIFELDESDVGGRAMRVKFSVFMNPNRKNRETLNSSLKRSLVYESPYKIYVGNLAWVVKPDEVRNYFCKFGTVISAMVMQDRKAGKSRAYGFLSFSTPEERDAALSANGAEFCGRALVVRLGTRGNDSGQNNFMETS